MCTTVEMLVFGSEEVGEVVALGRGLLWGRQACAVPPAQIPGNIQAFGRNLQLNVCGLLL